MTQGMWEQEGELGGANAYLRQFWNSCLVGLGVASESHLPS